MLGPPDEEVGINIDGGADERPEPGQEVHIELQHRDVVWWECIQTSLCNYDIYPIMNTTSVISEEIREVYLFLWPFPPYESKWLTEIWKWAGITRIFIYCGKILNKSRQLPFYGTKFIPLLFIISNLKNETDKGSYVKRPDDKVQSISWKFYNT